MNTPTRPVAKLYTASKALPCNRMQFTTLVRAWLSVRHILAVLALAVLITGCSVLNPGPPPVMLELNPALPPAVAMSKSAKQQVTVATPVAGRAFDSDSIALLFNSREIRYLAETRWVTAVPQMVQRSLKDSLAATGAFRGVADESVGISANVKLLSEIRQFWLRYENETAPPVAEFVISMQLLDLTSGTIIASRTFQSSAPAAGTAPVALAAACETALSKALAEIAPWVVSVSSVKKGK